MIDRRYATSKAVMIMTQSSLQADLVAWKPAQFRFTVFPKVDSKLPSDDWWDLTFGASPESKTEQSRLKETLYESSFRNGVVILRINPTRIDWIYTVRSQVDIEKLEIASLGDYGEHHREFIDLVRKWLRQIDHSQIMRMALGAILLQPVSSMENGFEVLSAYLKHFALPEGEKSDFLYQINRPRVSSQDPDIKMNRLSKWAVVGIEGEISQGNSLIKTPIGVAASLEIDINTTAERTYPLPGSSLPALFDELVELELEIAINGDSR